MKGISFLRSFKAIIQLVLGTDQFVKPDVSFDPDTMIITISCQLPKSCQSRCSKCNRKSPGYDSGRGTRKWRAMDIGAAKVFVETKAPRVKCKEHGVVVCAIPWARYNSRFVKNFEEQVTWLTTHTSKKVVSELMRIEWHTTGDICGRVYSELEKTAPNRFDGLVNIGIDETSYKKGHKYMTIVVNHDTNSVIWCHDKHGKEVLSEFFELLTPEQLESIKCVSADGARWIASCIEEYCPNAERCVDPFHVVSWAQDVMDSERRAIWSEVNKQAKAAPKRSKGRPKKGEVVNVERKLATSLKGMRFALWKNPENLTNYQRDQLNFVAESNPKLHKAYLLKEGLRLAISAGPDDIEQALNAWMSWAQRCRIPSFVKLRAKIKRHYDAIIASARHGLSNARIEATNNKIKLLIRTAYGFKNLDNLFALIMLSCSNVKPTLPGR